MGILIASLANILDAMADNIRAAIDGIDFEIQVEPWYVIFPTTVTIDMFPADPPTDDQLQGFGDVESDGKFFTVRARTSPTDSDAVRDVILSLMDVEDDHSVAAALQDDQTLNGFASQVIVTGRTGLSAFPTPDGVGAYLGCQWTVEVVSIPS